MQIFRIYKYARIHTRAHTNIYEEILDLEKSNKMWKMNGKMDEPNHSQRIQIKILALFH